MVEQPSHRLLEMIRDQEIPMIVPALVLPEVADAVARGHDDSSPAIRFAETLARLPHLILVEVDGATAQRAAEIAAAYRLRGADAVYAAVAKRFGSILVTLDQEQKKKVAELIDARTPAETLMDEPS
jgi:predicted nucleic acid-binding protein